MNYTLSQLQTYAVIVKHASITKAAEELHLSQPAVSIQLKNFQDQFDIPLTVTIKKRIFVTDFGKEIYKEVEEILLGINKINNKAQLYNNHLEGKLKISAVSTGKYIMPFFLADFLKIYPGIKLSLDFTNKQTVLSNLENNESDFSLVSILPKDIAIRSLNLIENKLYLVGKKNIENKDILKNPKDLENIPIVYREKGSGTRQSMENYFLKQNIVPKNQIELTTNEAVKQALLAGLGYSIMPIIGIKNELSNNELEIVPMKGLPITSNWSLICPKDKVFSPVAQSFFNYLTTNREQIARKYFGVKIQN
jgi:DNA-binding transcriptional LysR family regulator